MTLRVVDEQRCLGALTASIVHEVTQPLTGVITNAGTCLRMLNADPPDVEGARETARRVLRDGQRAAQVVVRLRALFAKKPARTEMVDLNDAAREVVASCVSDLERNLIVVRTDMDDDLPRVAGDRVQLQQVILNLLLNASDAMVEAERPARQLVIKTELEGADRVKLSVQDEGTGLDKKILDRLFEPLCTTKSSGMGMGLFVSRAIIESHHGCLTARQNDGPGATFSFSIPRSDLKTESSPVKRGAATRIGDRPELARGASA